MRFNLDPFGRYSDDEIWRALDRTCPSQDVCVGKADCRPGVRVLGRWKNLRFAEDYL